MFEIKPLGVAWRSNRLRTALRLTFHQPLIPIVTAQFDRVLRGICPPPQARSSAGHIFSQPQQMRSGFLGWMGNFDIRVSLCFITDLTCFGALQN